jgi:hypothetical protein
MIDYGFARYFWIILLAFLAACGKQSIAPPTKTPVPTDVSPVPTSTEDIIFTLIAPTPLPTQPIIPVITPDSNQVERWKEYETALAKSIYPSLTPEISLCEWDILGSSDQEVYVWVTCDVLGGGRGADAPAVIYLNADGSIQNVKIPGSGSDYVSDILKMFPIDIQENYDLFNYGRAKILSEHLDWRQTHPEVPPLIILSATPVP